MLPLTYDEAFTDTTTKSLPPIIMQFAERQSTGGDLLFKNGFPIDADTKL